MPLKNRTLIATRFRIEDPILLEGGTPEEVLDLFLTRQTDRPPAPPNPPPALPDSDAEEVADTLLLDHGGRALFYGEAGTGRQRIPLFEWNELLQGRAALTRGGGVVALQRRIGALPPLPDRSVSLLLPLVLALPDNKDLFLPPDRHGLTKKAKGPYWLPSSAPDGPHIVRLAEDLSHTWSDEAEDRIRDRVKMASGGRPVTDEEEARLRLQAEKEEEKLAISPFFFPPPDEKGVTVEYCLGKDLTQLDPDRRSVHAFANLRRRFHELAHTPRLDFLTDNYPRNQTPVPVSTPSGRWFGQDPASALQAPAPANDVWTAGVLPRPPTYRPLMRDIPLAWETTPKDYYIKPPTPPPPSTGAPLTVSSLGAHVPKDSMGVKSQRLIPTLPRTSSGALRVDPTAPITPAVAPSGLTASDLRQYDSVRLAEEEQSAEQDVGRMGLPLPSRGAQKATYPLQTGARGVEVAMPDLRRYLATYDLLHKNGIVVTFTSLAYDFLKGMHDHFEKQLGDAVFFYGEEGAEEDFTKLSNKLPFANHGAKMPGADGRMGTVDVVPACDYKGIPRVRWKDGYTGPFGFPVGHPPPPPPLPLPAPAPTPAPAPAPPLSYAITLSLRLSCV
ncbi:hypothetical protein JCM10049v2_004388 [Rhodotorula toruloides]